MKNEKMGNGNQEENNEENNTDTGRDSSKSGDSLRENNDGLQNIENENSENPGENETDPEESEVELWMLDKTDEHESDSDKMPVASHVKIKQKLRGKIEERDDEITRLKAENEKLKTGIKPQQAITTPKRPRVSDFEDDDAYEKAMDKYEEERLVYQTRLLDTTNQQTQSLQARKKFVERNVEQHYDRAAKLVEKNGIDPEVYRQAMVNVETIIESEIPKAGKTVLNEFISLAGEGSEKTMYFLGRNKEAQEKFKQTLRDDKTGLRAAFFLGKQTERIKGTKKQRSGAPAPALDLKGDSKTSESGKKLLKKYKEALESDNAQAAYNIKKQAKVSKIDTSSWR